MSRNDLADREKRVREFGNSHPFGISNPALILARSMGLPEDDEEIKKLAAYCDEIVGQEDFKK